MGPLQPRPTARRTGGALGCSLGAAALRAPRKGHGVGSAAAREKTREAGEGPVALCKALGGIVLATGRFSLSAKQGAAVLTARSSLARVAFLGACSSSSVGMRHGEPGFACTTCVNVYRRERLRSCIQGAFDACRVLLSCLLVHAACMPPTALSGRLVNQQLVELHCTHSGLLPALVVVLPRGRRCMLQDIW